MKEGNTTQLTDEEWCWIADTVSLSAGLVWFYHRGRNPRVFFVCCAMHIILEKRTLGFFRWCFTDNRQPCVLL